MTFEVSEYKKMGSSFSSGWRGFFLFSTINEPIQLLKRLDSSHFSVAFTKKQDNEHKMQKRMSLTERLRHTIRVKADL